MDFVLFMMGIPVADYVETAVQAERLGFHSVIFADHVASPREIAPANPASKDGKLTWDESEPFPDAWVTAAALAASTKTLRFMSGIYLLPLRHPIVVAHALATAALFSDNRVILGAGVGWMREEFDALDSDFTTRGRRMSEAIVLMRKLWSGEYVKHRGADTPDDPIRLSIIPEKTIPIYLGGGMGPAMERVAQLGDGWILPLASWKQSAEMINAVTARREQLGKAGQPFATIASGSGCTSVDDFHRLKQMGATGVRVAPWQVFPPASGVIDRATRIKAMERFARDVIQEINK
jgi:probable F420-dependent oxidoreductase